MRLKVLSKEDCERVREWRNETEGVLRTTQLLTEEMQEDFYEKVVCNRNSNSRYWGIWENLEKTDKKDVLIGISGIENISWENGLGEISLLINPEHSSKGYGTESVKILLNKAFNELRLDNVYGECYESNGNVDFWIKMCNKFNGKTAKLCNRKFYNGKFFDSLYFNFNKEDFNKCHK